MLQIKNLSYAIGDRELLSGAETIINVGRRIALIGRNGTGKTTLLKILAGELEYDAGEIITPSGYKIGYLPQEEINLQPVSLLRCVLDGQEQLAAIESQIQTLREKLDASADGDADKTTLDRLGTLEDQYRNSGGYEAESNAKAILLGLGFSDTDYFRTISEFSGGWRMRAYLARLLLNNPDLLMLDEPTNHLDLESLEWLEHYLKTFPGSMMIVSHDRYFVDRLANEICELDRGKLTTYHGNYAFFEAQKQLEIEKIYKRWEEQRIERERIQRFIDRFRYKASKAKQVQSRVKQLEKMEQIELPEEDKNIRFHIRVEQASYKDVLGVNGLAFRYTEDWVLKRVDLNIYRGEKIALVGVNGAGKTTMTRLIMGELEPEVGNIKLGERVVPGYYAQHQVESLDLDATILETVTETAAAPYRPIVRDVLGMFNLSGDDVNKRTGVLSGGEKARVSLAKILISPVNFLIMDEPTNHLDISSREALEDALEGYDGTLLLISHDRYFLDRLVTKVIELKNGTISTFEGNYSDYLAKRRAEDIPAPSISAVTEEKSADSPARKTKEQKRVEAEARQAISKERNQYLKIITECESKIERLENRKSELETILASPDTYSDNTKAIELQKEYNHLTAELTETFSTWEEAQERYEAVMEKLE